MKNEKETTEKLLDSAKKEFFENGYTKASLRKICADAGVTTGALYFFFKNKDDLFRTIVEPPLLGLIDILSEHLYSETPKGIEPLIRYIYNYYDVFIILLTRSQGSEYEDVIDRIVETTEKGYRISAENMAAEIGNCHIDEYMLHWLVHMNIDTFIHLITHEKNVNLAIEHMEKIMKHLIALWFDIILIKD